MNCCLQWCQQVSNVGNCPEKELPLVAQTLTISDSCSISYTHPSTFIFTKASEKQPTQLQTLNTVSQAW